MFALKYAYKSIIRRKRKNFITSLAIALGVALFIGAQSAGDATLRTIVQGNLNDFGKIDITISNPSSGDGFFPANITDKINADSAIQNNIVSMVPIIQFTTSVYSEGLIEADVIMNGIQPDSSNFGKFYDNEKGDEIDLGSKLRGLGTLDVIVSKTLSEDLELKLGESITFSFAQGNGSFTPLDLIVSEIYDDSKGRGLDGIGFAEETGQFYVNLEIIQNGLIPEFQNSVNQINIIIEDVNRDIDVFNADKKSFPGKSKIESTMDALNVLFEAEGIDKAGNTPLIFSDRVTLANTVSNHEIVFLTKSILPIFAFMLNGVALLLVINVQSMAVDDRKNQTAVLRALGSSISTIFVIFLIEATIVGLIGAIIGFGLGLLVSAWMFSLLADVYGVASAGSPIDPNLVLIAIIFGVVLSVITAVGPSLNAARSNVSNALRGIDEVKPPRKGYITLIAGGAFTTIGLLFALNIGEFWKREAWNTFEKQGSIMLGLGLTLAGLALLFTTVISRRLALSLSGFILWGLGMFVMTIAAEWIGSGDPATWFPIVLFYIVAGSSIVVAQNYDSIMNWLMKALFLFVGLRAIGQVTTRQMIGKKSRGVLVFTILSIILFLSIFMTSSAETQRVNGTSSYNPMSFGVDIQVSVSSPLAGIGDRLSSLHERENSLGLGELPSINSVYSFRRALVPFYINSPMDLSKPTEPNQDFDATQDLIYVPVIEIPQVILKPDGSWGETSLPLRFRFLSNKIKEEATVNQPSIKDSKQKHLETSESIFDVFYDPVRNIREQEVTINNRRNTISQTMVIGSASMYIPPTSPIPEIAVKGLDGFNFYLQDKNDQPMPMYIGATTHLDMLGVSGLLGYGILVTEDIANQLPQFDDLDNPNLFLVKSTNKFQDNNNELLADAIEKDLNLLSDPNSFSSEEGQLVGATSLIVSENVEEFLYQEAGLYDFFASFVTLGLVIGAAGMMIIAVRSVSERTREIGMMRSIGFSRRSVIIGVVIELLAISIVGMILGIINAVFVVESFASSTLGVAAEYPMGVLLSYIGAVVGLGLIAGIIPGYSAAKIAPSEAMRYTG